MYGPLTWQDPSVLHAKLAEVRTAAAKTRRKRGRASSAGAQERSASRPYVRLFHRLAGGHHG